MSMHRDLNILVGKCEDKNPTVRPMRKWYDITQEALKNKV